MKVYIVRSSYLYESMFKKMGFEVTEELDRADMMCFTGGSDICPTLYEEPSHRLTFTDPQRDRVEQALWEAGRHRNLPMVGICRGGQLLNVLNGGKMWQHITAHTKPHKLTDLRTKKEYLVSSAHHQMMIPGEGALIVATSKVEGCKVFDHVNNLVNYDTEEIEALWYSDTQSLCFQPHPEVDIPEDTYKYFHSLVTYFYR